MRVLIVYESMFGNTQTIAEAIGRGATSAGADVQVVEVSAAPVTAEAVDLLIVGGPTHTFTLSRGETRASAAGETPQPLVSEGIGLREWLDALPPGQGGQAAAFDTHADMRLPGSASKAARKRLRRLGFTLVAPPTSFFVADKLGPLLDGESDRAETFGAELAASARAQGHAARGR